MTTGPRRLRLAGRSFDVALATALFLGCEAEVITDVVGDPGHDHWSLAANIAVVAGVTVPLAWRRRAPLTSLILVYSSVFLLMVSLADVKTVNLPQLVLFIAPYSVAAYAARTRALLGLAFAGGWTVMVNTVIPSGSSSWVFSVGACLASWTAGRILRARRAATVELRHTTDRLTAERGNQELLAIAEQRTRIARELQALIANTVSTMIVQTQTAQLLLDQHPDQADAAMETIEDTGRKALIEMRRILGVLRQSDAPVELAPQPGVGQIPDLVEAARSGRQRIVLQVEGEPGPLPASVDLGVYRILEDALANIADTSQPVEILLRFGPDDIELNVTLPGRAHLELPTIAMRERVALCQGAVDVDSIAGPGERLVIRLPRVFEAAVA